jgi:HEAT repeat protein
VQQLRGIFCLVAALMLGSAAVRAADMPADVAAEVAKLKDADPKVRQKALAALGKMGDKAKSAMPAILGTLDDKTTWVFTKAIMVINEIGPDETVIKPLTPFLAKFPDIRSLAVDVFVTLGDKGVPGLIEALKDETTAEGACEALLKLGPKGKPAAAQLTEVSSKHKSKPVRELAAKALKAVSGK